MMEFVYERVENIGGQKPRENITSIFSFSQNVFKSLPRQGR